MKFKIRAVDQDGDVIFEGTEEDRQWSLGICWSDGLEESLDGHNDKRQSAGKDRMTTAVITAECTDFGPVSSPVHDDDEDEDEDPFDEDEDDEEEEVTDISQPKPEGSATSSN